jgi:hypothetical protein
MSWLRPRECWRSTRVAVACCEKMLHAPNRARHAGRDVNCVGRQEPCLLVQAGSAAPRGCASEGGQRMIDKTATISGCGQFRYRLGRRWSGGPPLVFVMLNPSTADAGQDDATIRRCVSFAQAHAFAAIDVVNLYAFRATKPADLRNAGYPTGDLTDWHIEHAVSNGGTTCVAWGTSSRTFGRAQVVLDLIRRLGVQPQCLRITRNGHPQHPLRLPRSCKLHPFQPAVSVPQASNTLYAELASERSCS